MLAVFFDARKLATRFKIPLLSPLLMATVVIIPILLLTGIPYSHYFKGSKVLSSLLQSTMVMLAYPLYEQLRRIHARWGSITTICFAGSVVATVTDTAIALLVDVSPQTAASVVLKSITAPVTMVMGGSVGDIPAISVVCTISVGILEAVLSRTSFDAMRIRTKAVRGLTMGTTSHVLGATRCAGLDYQEGTFSSLALVICGIIILLIVPFLFPIILVVMDQPSFLSYLFAMCYTFFV